MQLISLLRFCLWLVLVAGATSLLTQNGRADAGTGDAVIGEGVYQRLQSSSIYERRKALDELIATAADEAGTVEILIRLFQSQDADEVRYRDFMQRVGRALQGIASQTTWTPGNVELLTSVLVDNDAHDSRATNLTASTVAGVARNQTFPLKAIDDLTTVLWHRVDKNPNRTRNDNTRASVVQALRHIQKRQGLPRSVIDAGVASLGSEPNSSVRRWMVLLLDDIARAQPASEAMVQALTATLYGDENATVRTLAARSLRGISAQRDHPRSLLNALQQAVAGDPDAAVRREALAGLMAAAEHTRSPVMLSQAVQERLLQDAAGDHGVSTRLQALQALGKVYATQAPDPASLGVLLERLQEESDRKVRGLVAVLLQEIHAHHGLEPTVLEPLIPLVTDDPLAEVRRSISRLFIGAPVEQDLAAWLKATGSMGLPPADVATTVALPDRPAQTHGVEEPILQTPLLEQYTGALSGDRSRAVRAEILQGLFALSLSGPLPQQAEDALASSLESDRDTGLRLQAAAVLLHNGLQHHRASEVFYPALDDGDEQVHLYAAFALVELNAVNGEVLPGLLGFALDPSAHRNLRRYSLRRLAHWQYSGRDLPDLVQAELLELTGEPEVEIRTEAWNALRQFDLGEQDWRRAAADDDLAIRRMAWRELEALGVAKTVWAKWRDPKQRLELIAVGLLGLTLLALVVGIVLFFWRLLRWWMGTGQHRGRMLAAQLLWLVAALLTFAVDAGLVFMVAVAHVGLSIKDLTLLNMLFSGSLAFYALVSYISWKLLPAR